MTDTIFTGKIVRNTKSSTPDRDYQVIGMYVDSKVGSKNYGKVCLSVKEVGKSKCATTWWFPKNGGINKSLEFTDSKFNEWYHSEREPSALIAQCLKTELSK